MLAALFVAFVLSTSASTVRCPHGLMPLGRNAIGPAAAAVLRSVPKKQDPQIVSAALAPNDINRGRQAKFECGTIVWRRTVVVYYTRRALLPSQSLSQGVAFVGRFVSGYRVWETVH